MAEGRISVSLKLNITLPKTITELLRNVSFEGLAFAILKR